MSLTTKLVITVLADKKFYFLECRKRISFLKCSMISFTKNSFSQLLQENLIFGVIKDQSYYYMCSSVIVGQGFVRDLTEIYVSS